MTEPIALIDMDGTLCDYAGAMDRDMRKIAEPGAPETWWHEPLPPHVKERKKLVCDQPGWWRNLARLELGFQLLEMLRAEGFALNILTHGPYERNNHAWTKKLAWAREHVPDVPITVTSGEKANTFGHVLVDDYPRYIRPWLKQQPRGLVLMPAQPWNETFTHPRVLRCARGTLDEALARVRWTRGAALVTAELVE